MKDNDNRSAVGAIDWAAVRARVAATGRSLEAQGAVTSAHARAILRARADALAAESEAAPRETFEVLEFMLSGERYAIETVWVREVSPVRVLTPLPGVPAFVRGIMPFRGEIVSVLDLRRFFDLADGGLPDRDKAIVLADGTMQFALLADVIVGVREIARDTLQHGLPTFSGIRADYLQGVAEGCVGVLDAGRLLQDPSIVVGRDSAR